ncbi:MAG: TadE/TadG family type IV pilus assembly protein [Pseudomonadota bacterium]
MFGLRTLKRFIANRRGGFALQAGVISPFLLMATAGGIDYYAFANHKAHLQETADAAALSAVREAVVEGWSPGIAQAIADAVIASNYGGDDRVGKTTYKAKAFPDENNRSVRIVLSQDHFPYFSARFFPSPQLSVTATATSASSDNICVIALEGKKDRALSLKTQSRLTAPTCAVYSNSTHFFGVEAVGSAKLQAPLICSGGGMKGPTSNFVGNASTNCPAVDDPLIGRPQPSVGGCTYNNRTITNQAVTLDPGVFCGGLTVSGSSDVTFKPGIYIMKDGPFIAEMTAKVHGSDVGFFFTGTGAGLQFLDQADIDFEGPKAGAMAGMLFFQDRNGGAEDFVIESSNARNMVGVVYLPKSALKVNSNAPVSQESAYTAFIVRTLRLGSGPNLVLNTAYGSTDVPVPAALSGGAGDIRLTN